MARIFRLLSRSWTISAPEGLRRAREKTMVICKVQLLDGTDLLVEVPKKEDANFLLQRVFEHLDLLEVDYFGLQFTDENNINKWLEGNKPIRKQINIHENTNVLIPIIFRFKVKFYSSQPSNLKEEITRYQIFLQVKMDIKNGRLPCPVETATELAALALQSEFGDYDCELHTSEFISQLKFIPLQNTDFGVNVLEKYKNCSGMSPATSELNYLNKARWLEMYGVDFHSVKGRDANQYKLGLVPSGILISEAQHKIGIFYWPKITKLQFKKKKIIIDVVERDDQNQDQEHEFVFQASSEAACKHLWKCSVEHHTFFRLSGADKPIGLKQSFLRMGSKFRYSGHTEMESLSTVKARKSVTFRRLPSQPLAKKSRTSMSVPVVPVVPSVPVVPVLPTQNGSSKRKARNPSVEAGANDLNKRSDIERIKDIEGPGAMNNDILSGPKVGRCDHLGKENAFESGDVFSKSARENARKSNYNSGKFLSNYFAGSATNKGNNFTEPLGSASKLTLNRQTGSARYNSPPSKTETESFGNNAEVTSSLASRRQTSANKGILGYLNASFSGSQKAASFMRSKSAKQDSKKKKVPTATLR